MWDYLRYQLGEPDLGRTDRVPDFAGISAAGLVSGPQVRVPMETQNLAPGYPFRHARRGHHTAVGTKPHAASAPTGHRLVSPAVREAFSNSCSETDLFVLEFQNEVLDFIAHNPPRWALTGSRLWMSPYGQPTGFLLTTYSRLEGPNSHRFSKKCSQQVCLTMHVTSLPTQCGPCPSDQSLPGGPGRAELHRRPSARNPTYGPLAAVWFRQLVQNILYQFHPNGSNFEASTGIMSSHRKSSPKSCLDILPATSTENQTLWGKENPHP